MTQTFDAKTLSERLREIRTGAGLTQEELANAIGVRRETIAGLELGRHSVTLETFAAICKRLAIDANYLLGLTPHPGRLVQVRLADKPSEIALLDFWRHRTFEERKTIAKWLFHVDLTVAEKDDPPDDIAVQQAPNARGKHLRQ